ncbi:MAG: diguanylate cyclase [Clostridia bacterium]|nr:diguanylate cyclase [Clostridia bacterium]
MKKDAWFHFPETLAARRQGDALRPLMTENFVRLVVIAVTSGLAILVSEALAGRAPVWFAILTLWVLGLVSFAMQYLQVFWPAWPQWISLVILSWAISGVALWFALLHDQETAGWMIFSLVLMASSIFMIRPLLDSLLSLLGPGLVAVVLQLRSGSVQDQAGLPLAVVLAIFLAFVAAAIQFDQKMRYLNLVRMAAGQQRQLEELALRDPVTSLYNEPAFRTRLSVELARAIRYKHPLCLLAFEIQDAGLPLQSMDPVSSDNLLAGLAAALNKTLRTTDILGRGQDGRFLVALPDTALANARIAATRIQATLAQFSSDLGSVLTMNCGISQHHGEAIEALLLVTEARMREALQLGPDQIVVE